MAFRLKNKRCQINYIKHKLKKRMERIKLNLCKALLIAVCSFIVLVNAAFAKNKENGFWTIEVNDKKEKYTIIRFYDDKQNLLYEEKIEGYALLLTSRSKKVLDRTLSLFMDKKLIATQVKSNKR